MKVILAALNAKYIHSCLAIHSLKAYAQKSLTRQSASLHIETVEYTINQPLDDILQDLCRRQPDLLAFSCYIWNIDLTKKLAALFHMVSPLTPIWVGGPEVSYDAEEFLQENESISGVMIGEGELIFTELVRAYLNHKQASLHLPVLETRSEGEGILMSPKVSAPDISDVPGIVWRNFQGELCASEAPAPLDLDTLVFPYVAPSGSDENDTHNHIYYYESSRGCPFCCSYCLSSLDKKVRFRSLPLVFRDLTFFLDHKIPLVKFVDRTFNCDHDRTLAIWRFLKEHDNGITRFHFEITADLLNEEELTLLATLRPGLVQLEIGVQSANEKTLTAIDRRQDLARLSQITEQIRTGGNIHQHLDLIAGLPFEDLESFSHSFDTVYNMKPSQLQLGFLKLLKGSKMHHMKNEYGITARPWAPYEVVSTRWLTPEDVFTLKGIEKMVETYYNSGQFQMTLTYLMHFVRRPWEFFSRLAAWMEENGYLQISHNRLTKYNLLRDFAQTLVKDNSNSLLSEDAIQKKEPVSLSQTYSVPDPAALDSILLYDLYLRENTKSRPDWAPDQTQDKKRIASLYASEALRKQYLTEIAAEPVRRIRHLTHIEIFPSNPLETARTGKTVKQETILLFRYDKRNPLDASAFIYQIT